MNCKSAEALLALYAEGDLEASRARDLELHLENCSSCQRFLIDLRGSQAMVKELAAESLDAASFNMVRQRVMQEVKRRQALRPPWWRLLSPTLSAWRPAWAAALAVLVLMGLLLQWRLWQRPTEKLVVLAPVVQRKPPEVPAVDRTESTIASSGRQSSDAEGKQYAKHPKTSVPQELLASREPVAIAEDSEPPVEQGTNLEPEPPQPADVSPEPPPQLVIKLITDDPNIVIIWLVDQEVHHN